MQIKLFLTTLLATVGVAHAEAPKAPSEAPYIVLSENHDEPNGYGFCIDTFGAGKSDLLHTHSCKPTNKDEPRNFSGNDTRFDYNKDSLQIASYAFEGFCMQVLVAKGKTEFALLECSDHPRQKFVYNETDQTIRLNEDRDSCVTVVSETVPAGPWVKRPLSLQSCNDTETSLKQWIIVSE